MRKIRRSSKSWHGCSASSNIYIERVPPPGLTRADRRVGRVPEQLQGSRRDNGWVRRLHLGPGRNEREADELSPCQRHDGDTYLYTCMDHNPPPPFVRRSVFIMCERFSGRANRGMGAAPREAVRRWPRATRPARRLPAPSTRPPPPLVPVVKKSHWAI